MAKTLYLDEKTGKIYEWKNGQFIEYNQGADFNAPDSDIKDELEKQKRKDARKEKEEPQGGDGGYPGSGTGDPGDESDDGGTSGGAGGDTGEEPGQEPGQEPGGGSGGGGGAPGDSGDDGNPGNPGGDGTPGGSGGNGQSGSSDSGTTEQAKDLLDKLDDLQNSIENDEVPNEEDLQKLVDSLLKKARDMLNKLPDGDLKDELQDALDALEDTFDQYKRIKKIQDTFNDPESREGIKSDNVRHKQNSAKAKKERADAAAEAAKRGKATMADINAFKRDLKTFMQNEIKLSEKRSYGVVNRRFLNTPFKMQGKYKVQEKKLPSVGVYFDQSGSWTDNDVQRGYDAIACLFEFKKKKQIELEVQFFSNRIYNTPEAARDDGGTAAGALLIEDIKKKGFDNVIVMTDHDFDSWGEIRSATPVKIKGAAWFLWKSGDKSYELVDHIISKHVREYNV